MQCPLYRLLLWTMNAVELTAGSNASRIEWVQVGLATGIVDPVRTRPVPVPSQAAFPERRRSFAARSWLPDSTNGDGKRPMCIAMETREPFACAGMRETRKDPEGDLLARERDRLRMSSETGASERLRHMSLAGRRLLRSRLASTLQATRTGTVKRYAS